MSLDVGGELGLGEDEGLGLGEGGEFGLGLEEELEPARLFSRLNSSGLFFKYRRSNGVQLFLGVINHPVEQKRTPLIRQRGRRAASRS